MRIILSLLVLMVCNTKGSPKEPVDYVNPFIGTSNSVRPSIWEANGGTYPGAVLPFGMVQVTPEDYHYDQNYIKSFSVVNHTSGYPNGSSGNFQIMPFISDTPDIQTIGSTFRHDKESAHPGYYSVFLDDYSINAEMTATEYAAFFKFNFPESENPGIIIYGISEAKVGQEGLTGKCDRYYFTLKMNDSNAQTEIQNSSVIIRPNRKKLKDVMIKIGFSVNDKENAKKNLQTSIADWDFEKVKKNARKVWNTQLCRILVEGNNEKDKEIFYSALYHTFLDPHLISDINKPKRYTELSPWDTYKCKQPLITLLEKSRQSDMIKSVLEKYDNEGKLDAGPMTGVHNVPIIVDSYLKNIRDFDVRKAYEAMKASLLKKPYGRGNIEDFIAHNYVPAEIGYSVTKTLEYSYDYWAMAQMAKELNETDDYKLLMKRSTFYTNIFNPDTKFMTAKSSEGHWQKGGYREGDKWVYNWTTVHDIQSLINLTGGKTEFVKLLDSCFQNGKYFHDNEPQLHIPYLFSYAGEAWKTQQAVRQIMELNYSTTPGGLSGNDDLGALSAWYVFSAMGFFPVCPGRPEYVIGSPLFEKVTITPDGGKPFIIYSENGSTINRYIQSARLNNIAYSKLWISHEQVMKGGTLQFLMGENPRKGEVDDNCLPISETIDKPEFAVNYRGLSTNVADSDESIDVRVNIQNNGKAAGSVPITIFLNDIPFLTKWMIVDAEAKLSKSIPITLYKPGIYKVSVNQLPPENLEIKANKDATFDYKNYSLPLPPIVRAGNNITIKTTIKNIGSYCGTEEVILYQNNNPINKLSITLNPGEEKVAVFNSRFNKEGWYDIRVGDEEPQKLLVYGPEFPNTEDNGNQIKPIMSFGFNEVDSRKIKDFSDLKNDALAHGNIEWVDGIFGKAIKTNANQNAFIEIPDHPGYKSIANGKTMSILLWIYPTDEKNFADIISKGDLNVIQIRASNMEVNYYSGGYQRGEAYTLLPGNWNRNWHHLAGVSDGKSLTLYINGQLMVKKVLEDQLNFTGTTNDPWNIGRNAANPDRVFDGYIDHVMVFDKALNEKEVNELMLFMNDEP